MAARAAPAADRNLGLLAGEPGELRDGDELEAAGAKRGNEALDRPDRLRAVAAAVVQEHDPAPLALRCRRGDDLVDPRPPPVLAVEVGEHDVVAAAGDFLERGACCSDAAAGTDEYGGRKSRGRMPTAPASVFSVRPSCSRCSQPGSAETSACVNVWLPSSKPSRRRRRTTSGWLTTLLPTTKNVAGACRRRSAAAILGVQRGSGPSSNVRAIRLPTSLSRT